MKNFKKVLGSVFTIGIVLVVGVLAVNAYFSDTETSTGNIFQAGEVDISLGLLSHTYLAEGTPNDPVENYVNIDEVNNSFQFNDLKPLDWGEMSGTLTNEENEAFVCARVISPNTAGVSPFQDMLRFRMGGGSGLTFAEGLTQFGVNQWFSLNPPQPALTMASGATFPASVQYCFGMFSGGGCILDPSVTDYNLAQGQVLTLDLEFYAVQTRNNPDFQCSSLNDQGSEVGANLSLYSVPTCDDTVTDTTDGVLQTAINNADSGKTVCVGDGTFNGPIVINSPLTLASLSGASTTATINGGVGINSSDVTVTGFKIIPGVVPGDAGNTGVFINGSYSSIKISSNNIDGDSVTDGRGILTTTGAVLSDVLITNNKIHNMLTGIYLNPHTGIINIIFNDFMNNTAGIGGLTGAHVIYNEFSSAGEAIGIDASYDSSVVEFNNFLTGTKVNTYGTVTPDVIAPNNWWADGSTTHIGGTNAVDPSPEAGAQYTHR